MSRDRRTASGLSAILDPGGGEIHANLCPSSTTDTFGSRLGHASFKPYPATMAVHACRPIDVGDLIVDPDE
ncbi:hypothetical protein ABZ297_22545 [Nonomuraea sp. NPDC005983]|uniref:hypothetical protein n=1 Tax=Nonomuraea sp. NPDC005983 TaxID=3155595 RepID=UPI0033B8F69B